jgi:hypothetical protein
MKGSRKDHSLSSSFSATPAEKLQERLYQEFTTNIQVPPQLIGYLERKEEKELEQQDHLQQQLEEQPQSQSFESNETQPSMTNLQAFDELLSCFEKARKLNERILKEKH